jgi:hypothetical protein
MISKLVTGYYCGDIKSEIYCLVECDRGICRAGLRGQPFSQLSVAATYKRL